MRIASLLALPLVGCCFSPTPVSAPTAPATPAVAPTVAPMAPPPAVPSPSPTTAPAVAIPAAPRERVEGFDVRATFYVDPLYVLQRGHSPEPDSEGDSGEDITLWRMGSGTGQPVRILREDGTICDGTLGARVRIRADYLDVESEDRTALASEASGCRGPALLAVVSPTPGAPWPEALGADDPAAAPALEAARAAMTTLARSASPASFDARAYRLEGSVYGMAWGPRCEDDEDQGCGAVGSAVVVIRPGAAAETLIVRRTHFPWDEPTGAAYQPCGVVDVDGDGHIELCERMVADQGAMIRLVRPGEERAGELAWRMEEVAEYSLPQAGPAPRPLATP